jgi:hypothetical protein
VQLGLDPRHGEVANPELLDDVYVHAVPHRHALASLSEQSRLHRGEMLCDKLLNEKSAVAGRTNHGGSL